MYGIDLSVQIENLMPALGLGFLLGLFYDVVRFLRLVFSKGKILLFITDMLFVVFCTLTSFLLIIGLNNGHIRFYLILAEITGAVVYFSTAGIIISALLHKISFAIKKAVMLIFSPLMFLKTKIDIITKKLTKKSGINLKKIQNKFKKPLQDDDDMLYNIND